MGMQGTAGQIVDESQFTGHRGHGGFVAGSHHFQAPHIIGIARSILDNRCIGMIGIMHYWQSM